VAEAIDQLERRQREPRLGDQPAGNPGDAIVIELIIHAVFRSRTGQPAGSGPDVAAAKLVMPHAASEATSHMPLLARVVHRQLRRPLEARRRRAASRACRAR
jgi:hypothetical protein